MAKNSMKPRIRFKGFTDAWEQRKLGDVGKAQSGIGFPDREQGGKEGVPFYKVSDMNNYGNEHEMHSANNYVTEEQCRRNGWTPITEISVVFAKVGAAIMLNRKRLVRFSFLLDNNTMAYRFGSGWDINFGKTLFERVDLTELVQIGALPSYNATDVESVEISMPDKPEQYQIGEFFKQLDNLITLHQRKQKCKFLSFPTSKAGLFLANSWEQREFNSIAKRITEMTDTEDLPRVEYEDIVSGQGTLNKDINKKKSCKTGILFDNGDVLFGKLRPYLKNWLFATFMGIAVGDFWVLRANNADGLYIYTLLQIDAFQDIANQSTGTKMPRADWSLVSKQRFLTPTVVPEQRKIGEFFKQLDNLITLHQCKDFALDTNKAFQQRCLLSIKSANAWEQRKLGEMGETYAGLSSKSKEDFGHGEAEFVPYMNVFTNPIADVAMTEAIEIDDRQAKVKNGDVLFTTSSETPEEVGMSSVWLKNGSNTYLNSFCFGFRASESINSYYLAYMLRSSGVRRKIVFLAQGISRYNISKKKMMEIKVPMPISAEQRQLGEIFRQLDNLITLHQRKQTIKKRSKMDEKRRVNYLMIANAWEQRKLREVFDYERPDTYIVKSDKYSDTYSTPVLTANKGFILGYTNEMQVCNKECIIFDDFTLDSKYVTFPFMVKSSALKILTAKIGYFLPFAYQLLQATNIEILGHARHYISVVQPTKVLIPSNDEQIRIGKCIQQIDNLITLHQRGLIKIQGDKKWQKRKFQKNCSAIILNAG